VAWGISWHEWPPAGGGGKNQGPRGGILQKWWRRGLERVKTLSMEVRSSQKTNTKESLFSHNPTHVGWGEKGKGGAEGGKKTITPIGAFCRRKNKKGRGRVTAGRSRGGKKNFVAVKFPGFHPGEKFPSCKGFFCGGGGEPKRGRSKQIGVKFPGRRGNVGWGIPRGPRGQGKKLHGNVFAKKRGPICSVFA